MKLVLFSYFDFDQQTCKVSTSLLMPKIQHNYYIVNRKRATMNDNFEGVLLAKGGQVKGEAEFVLLFLHY